MLTRHLFNLCESPHPHTYVHTHNLTTTSPVSGSLIKLTGAGPSGQAETSEPSPSCHDMMDLSTTGCQAATQVHLPVGIHQETLAKHPVDLICIYPTSPFTSTSYCMSKGGSRLALLPSSTHWSLWKMLTAASNCWHYHSFSFNCKWRWQDGYMTVYINVGLNEWSETKKKCRLIITPKASIHNLRVYSFDRKINRKSLF